MATSMDKANSEILEARMRIEKMRDAGDANPDEVVATQRNLLKAVVMLDVYVPLERSLARNVGAAIIKALEDWR